MRGQSRRFYAYEQRRTGSRLPDLLTGRGAELRCDMRDLYGHLIENGQATMIPAHGWPD